MQRFLFILGMLALSACAHNPELKTELDQSTGTSVTSSKPMGLNPQNRYSSLYGRNTWDDGPVLIQVLRLDRPDSTKAFEIKIFADGQSPRLNILKENSLVFILNGEELKYSPSKQEANDKEPLAEYFPSFRKESATFSNISESDLRKLATGEEIHVKILGESGQFEHRLVRDVQEVMLALLPPAPTIP